MFQDNHGGSETIRYHMYNCEPHPETLMVDPKTLRWHESRDILNLNEDLARRLLDQENPHYPIRVYGKDVIDGSRRVQAAIFLNIPTIPVKHQ